MLVSRSQTKPWPRNPSSEQPMQPWPDWKGSALSSFLRTVEQALQVVEGQLVGDDLVDRGRLRGVRRCCLHTDIAGAGPPGDHGFRILGDPVRLVDEGLAADEAEHPILVQGRVAFHSEDPIGAGSIAPPSTASAGSPSPQPAVKSYAGSGPEKVHLSNPTNQPGPAAPVHCAKARAARSFPGNAAGFSPPPF